MILITVSIFGAKEAKSRWQGAALSAVFVLGIICLFAPLGVIAALSGKGLGGALGNPWVVGFIALVSLALAASMFGAFDIALPASLNNRLATVGGVGYKGAFALGLVCGIVAAPCVGPFLFGLLTWIATTRDVAIGSAAMTFYALGLGTLFFVVGTFAINLPKAGAWMMAVKWGSGVILAYMALAYVRDALPKSVAAKVAHPGTAYGVIALLLALVGIVLAVVHVAAERRKSRIAHLSKRMKLLSIAPAVAGSFMFVTWFQMPRSSVVPVAEAQTNAPEIKFETSEPVALARAAAEHKPVLIDFGATWCGACKEIEEKTFPEAPVRAEAARFVVLHVDCTDWDDAEVAATKKKYKVIALPVVLLIDSSGKEVSRFTEFVSAADFVPAMQAVH
jgi:thiol:disulfide interchange protein DsbD